MSIASAPVATLDDLWHALARYHVGETVPVTIIRDGKRLTVPVTLQKVE